MNEMSGRDFLKWWISWLSVWLLAFATTASVVEAAQDLQTPLSPSDSANQTDLDARAQVLKQWVDDYSAWKRLRDEKATGVGPRKVLPKPEPPSWLAADCIDTAVDGTGLWADACRLLIDWDDDALTAELRRQITESRAQKEAPTKTRWLQHLHLDTLWPMTQWGSNVYGVVGVHVTVEVAGRFQLFVAPGAMLLNVPGELGGRDWKVATDWGIAYRLLDFKLPGGQRHAQLHGNLVTAWVLNGPESLVSNRITLAGFSFTFKQPPAP